jgi:hypothetical protein
MKVSHARTAAMTSAGETAGQPGAEVPGMLEVLALVPDTRKERGRRFALVFILAVAVACVLAQAKSFREIGDHAADLPQEVLARLGGKPHPLRRRIVAPSGKRIRTLVQGLDAENLDELIGGWLRILARAGRLEPLLTAIAIDGKWLRGVGDGQVKLFAAMLHEEKTIIAQHRIPDETTETTQVKDLLETVDLDGAVITADAAHACRQTAQYIAGHAEDGGRDADYFLFVKGNQPGVQRAVFDLIQAAGRKGPRPRRARLRPRPRHQALPLGHRRRRPGLPAGQQGRPDPPRPLRHRRRPHQQGNRPRRHQPGRRPGQRSGPRRHRPRPVGHRVRPLAARHRLGRRRKYRIRRERPPGHGHLQEHRGQPALPRRRHGNHTHYPGNRTRPDPDTQLPASMRPASQTTLPTP